jgi:uridine kinase
LNPMTDEYDNGKEYFFSPGTIAVLEGVFLFREELSPFTDYKIFLEISFEECLRRAQARDSREIYSKYAEKYIPAQKKYLAAFPPEKNADMIIDNSDWQNPRITRISRL